MEHKKETGKLRVSIPSPSGLLQNLIRSPAQPLPWFQSLLLQVSFKTCISAAPSWPRRRFNPFSFRSPSKHRRPLYSRGLWFQSLLLQVSFKTPAAVEFIRRELFQSLLLQVSFKTLPRTSAQLDRFQSLLLQVSFKTRKKPWFMTGPTFQSLLLQVSFKTRAGGEAEGGARVSIPSPSGLLQNTTSSASTVYPTFQSLLLQVSFKTGRSLVSPNRRRFNPFSFRSPSKRQVEINYPRTN